MFLLWVVKYVTVTTPEELTSVIVIGIPYLIEALESVYKNSDTSIPLCHPHQTLTLNRFVLLGLKFDEINTPFIAT